MDLADRFSNDVFFLDESKCEIKLVEAGDRYQEYCPIECTCGLAVEVACEKLTRDRESRRPSKGK